MNFSKSLATFGTADFDDDFSDDVDINFNDLDCINDLCENGGWPQFKSVAIRGTEERENQIVVRAMLDFIESAPTSCADQNREYPQMAAIAVTIEKSDGSASAELTDHPYPCADDDDDPDQEWAERQVPFFE
ncbi:MAG TPA: hypothetical protein VFG04_23185 [Planctomycetaceae bacterium]|jgi:hypothetical protein|nr:hypothetical protein [Planctomycetaceae bacterium]